jgi:hypothetical protein
VVVEALLAAGADPDAPDQRGVTPSIGAAVNGHVEVVCAVLGAGAQIRRPASHSGLAALAASVAGKAAVTWVLLEKGAEAKSTDESGRPVLVTAAASGNPEACRGYFVR